MTTVINGAIDINTAAKISAQQISAALLQSPTAVNGPLNSQYASPASDIEHFLSLPSVQIAANAVSVNNLTLGDTSRMLSTKHGSTYAGYATGIGGRTQKLTVDFDEAVWEIYVPGIEAENISVFTVANKVYVDINDGEITKDRKVFELDEGERVKETKLELGILKVTIDRPAKRQVIEIG